MSAERLRDLFDHASDIDIARVAAAWEARSADDLLEEFDRWDGRYPVPVLRRRMLSFSIFLIGVALFVALSLPLAISLLHVNRGADGHDLSRLLSTDLAVSLTCPHRPGDLWRFISRTGDFDIAPATAMAEVCGGGGYRAPETLATVEGFPSTWIDEVEERTVNAINEVRATRGKRPLRRHDGLDDTAQQHTRFMANSGLFQHSEAPYGENILKMPVGYVTHTRLGKPIVRAIVGTPADIAGEAVEAWMDSPIHRKNILNDTYVWTGLGVGVADAPDGDGHLILFTQTLASRLLASKQAGD